ncbi:histidine kinase, partial [Xanthomonas citri pv. citri]|nr:histidine kinase [Xanthomonas citri pv. citri]
LAARAARARQVQDAAAGDPASAGLLDVSAMAAAGGQWALAAPLVVAERPLGVVSCAFDAPRASAAEDAALLRALAVVFGAA